MQLPPLTIKLLWAAAACLLLPWLVPQELQLQLLLWPVGEVSAGFSEGLPQTFGFRPWQLITHLFINSGVADLLFIGLTLVFFGANLEHSWGQRRYGLFLLACAGASALLTLALITLGSQLGVYPFLPVGGATGVMFGILFGNAYLNPNQQVMLLIPPIPMKMKTLVIGLCAIFLATSVFGGSGGWGSLGFLGGLLGAWLHILYWRGKPPFGPRKPPGLRVVK